MKSTFSNPVLDFALNQKNEPFGNEKGLDRIVAFGDKSHKCPTYIKRVPPCSGGCPASEDIRGYHNILRGIEKTEYEDKWEAAFHRITEKNPFPSIMGRVCPAPCESACNRQYLDETIGINAVEHAIGDYAIKNNIPLQNPNTPKTGKKVAVVGSGPAGLSCAYQLKLKGHDVTIYESHSKLGGMMQWTILEYRIPRNVLNTEIQRIINLGINYKTNVHIGKDTSLEKLREEYDAVFLGIGAQQGRMLPIPGGNEAKEGYTNAIDFLKSFEYDRNNTKVGNNVIVIGDGDVAMDVLRLALRLGSKNVTLISGVPRADMACSEFEFHEAEREGSQFKYALGSQEIIVENNKVVGLKVVEMQAKEKGENGWNAPIPFLRFKPKPNTEKIIKTDMIVSSIGQLLDLNGLDAVKNTKSPWLNVNKQFQIQGNDDLFSAGDCLSPTLLTTAIGQGRKAAYCIDAYITNKPMPQWEREDIIPYDKLSTYHFEQTPQVKRSHKDIDKNTVLDNYSELLQKLNQEDTVKESDRCMSCGLCFECNQCMLYCPQEAITKFKNNPIGEVMYTYYDKCVGCHICAEVCPCGYIHMGMGEDL